MAEPPPMKLEYIPLTKIRVSPENVRRTDRDAEIVDLANSIKQVGVLQPVVVTRIPGENRYDLIIGQRRFQAAKLANLKTIPAVIRPEIEPLEKIALSLAENIQRRRLPYKDTIRAIGELFDKYKKASTVAKIIGISEPTVRTYLTARDIPHAIQEMVDSGKISRIDAGRAWTASGGNIKKAIAIARALPRLSKSQKERLVMLAEQDPKKGPRELLRRARQPPKEKEVILVLPTEYYEGLNDAAAEQSGDAETIARRIVMEWLDENGYI